MASSPSAPSKLATAHNTYNEVLGETGAYTVTATISHVDQVVEYVAIDGERLATTLQEHPFYRERGWVEADDPLGGCARVRADGRIGVVQGIEVIKHRQPMYNLTVAQAHTYFVGDGQWLVHNCPVRNPFGRRGGPRTRRAYNKQNNTSACVDGRQSPVVRCRAGWPDIAATGGRRFPDLVMEPVGAKSIQVGRVTRAGRPVSRERGPLTELRSTGLFDHVFYLKYP